MEHNEATGTGNDPTGEKTVAADALTQMAFPHAARLELDDLLDQLVARARDVQDTQGRLRGLLRAYLEISAAVDLDTVLVSVVSAARQLVNASYAALGVVRDGKLVRFVHEGMDAGTVARIGALPEGKGLLGRLVDYPQPLRLADIGGHFSSVGFPEGHPPMRSFLGVPIQVAGRVFGNLYLTDKQGSVEFSGDDQELVQALAAAAGLAIANARLFDQIQREQDWQIALVEITTSLLSGDDPSQGLRDLVRHARSSAHATGAGVFVPAGEGQLRMTVAEGTYAQWPDREVPTEGSVAGAALLADCAILVADPRTDPRTSLSPVAVAEFVGPTLAVPIPGAEFPAGVLCVSRSRDAEPFDESDQALIGAFASRAGLALGLAAARRQSEQTQLAEDRWHIADQLREHVISRLFAAGLTVQALVPRVTSPAVQQALRDHVGEIDSVIADIRSVIFSLRRTAPD